MIHWKEYDGYYKCTADTIYTCDTETSSYWILPDGRITGYDAKFSNEEYNEMVCGAVVYIWMLGINDDVIYGRDLHELPAALAKIREHAAEDIIVYIHNLAYDFQFFRNVFNFSEVFARTQRKPMYARAAGIEFRCSYMLTRLSLDSWGKQLNLEAKKMTGLLDYHVLRSPKTKLTADELKYCEFDIKTMYYGLRRYQMKYGSVKDIVLTQTGEVRKPVKQMFTKDNGYHFKITKLQPTTFEEYTRMKAAFWGGDTHANRRNACKKHKHVGSFDKTSDYPYQMCAEKYPMTRFMQCSTDLRFMKPDIYAYIIMLDLYGVKSKCCTTYISKSHTVLADAGWCVNLDKVYNRKTGERLIVPKRRKKLVCDNGRIIDAEHVVLTITEQDLPIIKACYEIREMKVSAVWRSRKEYLPKKYIEFILDLYEKKTQLKDEKDFEDLYMQSKQFLNSLFGMMVTDILMADIKFKDNTWLEVEDLTADQITDKLQEIHKKWYKNDLAYQWGIWVTAYARRELLEAVLYVGDDECYHDTDSVKMLHYWKYFDYFRMKDAEMDEKLKAMCDYYDIDFERTRPRKKNGKGAAVPLGHWNFEAVYREAVFEGAKKYCYNTASKDYTCYDYKKKKWVHVHNIHITVAGVPKAAAAELHHISEFHDGLEFDRETCGKKLLIYLDGNNACVELPDGYVVKDKYAVCMRNNGYTLGITDEYAAVIGVINDSKGIIRFNVA